jgi:hypothetical protein
MIVETFRGNCKKICYRAKMAGAVRENPYRGELPLGNSSAARPACHLGQLVLPGTSSPGSGVDAGRAPAEHCGEYHRSLTRSKLATTCSPGTITLHAARR